MKIVQSILTQNPCYKAGRKITVKKLMLHSVGCAQPSATVFTKRWNSASYDRACVHAFIDANDGTVYQTLPWNHRAWHSGGSANNDTIGVEMCESSYIKYIGVSDKFNVINAAAAKAHATTAYNAAVELFAYLCKQYNLDPLTDILSHAEGAKKGVASGHSDPEHYWTQLGTGYTMNGFRKDVKAAMGGAQTTTAAKKTIDQLAQEVIAGKWGNGADRRNRLEAAGYDYETVQAAVRAKLNKPTTTTKKETVMVELRKLSKGMTGNDVRQAMLILKDRGYYTATIPKTDNEFGPKMYNAVIAFQKAEKIDPDGVIGKDTWGRLLEK